jgi:hypothetical protein
MFPRLETRNDRPGRSRPAPAHPRTAVQRDATSAPSPSARLRRVADLLLAFVSLDALGLPSPGDELLAHPHRRDARVDLPGRRAGMPPRPDQVCVTPRPQARRPRDRSKSR